MSVRIAVVQAKADAANPQKNVQRAITYVEQAAAQGAQIVCLPETYPGPWTTPLDYDAVPDLAGCARDLDLYLVAGFIEPSDGSDGHHNCLVLLGPDGVEVGRYRRTTPHGPWIYKGGDFWDFAYAEGTDLPVFETRHCCVGMLICSEVYVPELARVLALKGAEIIFLPAGLWKGAQWDTWRVLTRARAIENLAFTATCQNILGHESDHAGLAMICSPEEVLVEATTEGVFVADCDLDRTRMLRQAKDGPGGFTGSKACKAGVLWQWHLPDLYGSG